METSIRFAAFLVVFAAMAAWETLRPRRVLAEPRRLRWPANLGLVALGALAARLVAGGAAVAAAIFAAENEVGLLHGSEAPSWLAWIATLLVLDFAVYLQHVLFHAVPILWRLHRVHHADLGFDASTGLRFHPIEILISVGLKAGVVVLLGAPAGAVVAFEVLLNASSLFNHGNVAIPEALDRRLRRVIVTPDMHRIHHSSRIAETNANFGFSVSWWDRLCGTYRSDPVLGQLGLEIGLTEYRRSLRLWELLVLPFRGKAGTYTFAGDRVVEGGRPTMIEAADLRERLAGAHPPLVLDVRSIEEWNGALGHIDGARLIPLPELDRRIDELGEDKTRLFVSV